MITQLRLNPNLLKVPLYIAGKSVEEVQEEYGLDDVVKLASNENALGPSPLALEAARRVLADAHRYPGIADRSLRQRLGPLAHPGFDEHYIITGNGATDIIRMISQAFIFDGGEMVTCRVTFPMYHICATMFGGEPVLVAPTPDLRFDLQAIADAIRPNTRLVFICTPNNPTGLICQRGEVEAFMRRVPDHVVVVFDESYRDFVEDPDYPDPAEYVAAERNVIVIRSFSKSAGLANLRVGYAIARPDLIEYLCHAQIPFNTGALALVAARASLDDREYLERNRCLVREEREFLYAALDALDLAYTRSQANFVMIADLPLEARLLSEKLIRHGVIVRPMAAWGLPNAIRVTLGLREQNQRFVSALRVVLDEGNGLGNG
ncbi:MAG TPA: histidinol-phosphate transaminase [Anaerolineae bacterium]|nr:histidinol-phosphate transaminase [Anaerolineae bacterium]